MNKSLSSLRNLGAKYIGNRMPRRFRNFSVCLSNSWQKKLSQTQQKPLYITSGMASAHLGILLSAVIWFWFWL